MQLETFFQQASLNPNAKLITGVICEARAEEIENPLGARETLDKAAGAAQDNPAFRAFRAAVLQRLTFHREAVSEYQAALRMLPQAGVWWIGLAISLEAGGRAADAREAYQRAKSTGALSVELSAFVEQKLKRLH